LVPQVIFVDGNGILHPRGFGLASHLGVLIDIPTIGIGKNLLCVDGLEKSPVKTNFDLNCHKAGDHVKLKGQSKKTWGAAFKSTKTTTNPIYISIGHKISLERAIELTRKYTNFRVPEPVRQADIISRAMIRHYQNGCQGKFDLFFIQND
jgi:deoxyinosine 3'endonuclease (endonuclease V)